MNSGEESTMYKCPYCNHNMINPGTNRIRYCENCNAYRITVNGRKGMVREKFEELRKKIPPYDENFEWRIFLTRVFLKNSGRVLEMISGAPMIKSIFQQDGFEYHTLDIDLNPATDDLYDTVILWDVLEYVVEPETFIKKCSKLINDHGVLLIRIKRHNPQINSDYFTNKDAPINLLYRKALKILYERFLNSTPLFIEYDSPYGSFIIAAGRKNERIVNKRMSVKVIAHPDAYALLEDAVGPRLRIFKTIFELRKLGVEADLSISMTPDISGYNLVHVFHHTWKSNDHIYQALSVKHENIPLVISTIYMDLKETNFALRAIPEIFRIYLQEEREAYLAALERGELSVGDFDQTLFIPDEPSHKEAQKLLFSLSDHIIGLSLNEVSKISKNLNIQKPFTIVPNCADPEIFLDPDPDIFYKKYGIKNFVISVGHIEIRKNTIMLIYALKDSKIPLVIVGNYLGDPDYYRLCKYYASENTIFIPQLKQDELASAFSLAHVHALPSWIEGASLASIEAAMSGCNVVVSDRAGEWEYYGEDGFYCNPASYQSIRQAISESYRRGDEKRRRKLRERILKSCTFHHAAKKTLEAYEKTLEGLSYEMH